MKLGETMTKNLPKSVTDTIPHVQDTCGTPRKIQKPNKSKPTCSHIFQTAESKDVNKNLKDSYGKEVCIKYRRRHLRITSDISTETMQ